MYIDFLTKTDAAEAAAGSKREQATNTEDLAVAMLNAITVSNSLERDMKAKNSQELQAVVCKAKDIHRMGAEKKHIEGEALFESLLSLSGPTLDSEAEKERLETCTAASKCSSL
jgi:hypothetical protein